MSLVLCGDALEQLKILPSESVDCCVTSPPYWALRDYGVSGQLGLEPTFTEYIDKLCNIFDEVKRVLKKGGTLWVNIGDTYYGGGNNRGNTKTLSDIQKRNRGPHGQVQQKFDFSEYQAKSLCQIPSRFAIEMCNRGWILRNKIVWHKPNCMPSSVKDRFTVDYEEVFFFVKSKKYYFEQQTEPMITDDISAPRGSEGALTPNSGRRKQDELGKRQYTGFNGRYAINKPLERNKRSVWSISTKPYKEAHFATYPETLIEPMIKAGCPVGGIVLDPFGGSGTTAQVAIKQNKQYILIELNPEYIPLIQKRLDGVSQQIKLEVYQ
jgi:DNA modification methylase